ncbi:hypothetical protein [Streptomyces sp. 6N223]|uniref:hypothetical protein n=1 Tax=Streptomyces sp. 6N223 TaxID=3457412 RepID=UPI003FD009C2
MPATTTTSTGSVPAAKRSRVRRAGESAYGALLLARLIVMGLLVLLVLAAGVRTSWDTAQHAMVSDGRDRGTLTLQACDRDVCVGSFAPEAGGSGTPREEVVLPESIGREPGESLSVALRPDTNEAVRTGFAGILYAWLPLTGALLLASLVIAGGLRMYRTAWATAGVALAALVLTFALY